MDLQVDFLAAAGARMPVAPADAARVVEAANAVLSGRALSGSLPVLVVNEFPRSARIANWFRHGAAIAGTEGAALDRRIQAGPSVRRFTKHEPNAFTNPELDPYLRANGVGWLHVLGVFAEGCVRATAVDGRRRGYGVSVALDAIGTTGEARRRFATWAMRRAGVELLPSLPADGR
jgi:nicotinamidase-related amidase